MSRFYSRIEASPHRLGPQGAQANWGIYPNATTTQISRVSSIHYQGQDAVSRGLPRGRALCSRLFSFNILPAAVLITPSFIT